MSTGGEYVITTPGTLLLGITRLARDAVTFSETKSPAARAFKAHLHRTSPNFPTTKLGSTFANTAKIQRLFPSISSQTTLWNKRIGEREPGTYFAPQTYSSTTYS